MMISGALHRAIRLAVMACFVTALVVAAYHNAQLVIEPAGQYLSGNATFDETTKAIASGYLSDGLWAKRSFVELNGLFSRWTARKKVNGVIRLNNGMLSNTEDAKMALLDLSDAVESMSAFSEYLASLGTRFIYVLRPEKMDVRQELLPAGLQNHTDENDTALLSQLSERGVRTIDLRPETMSSVEAIDRSFYRTDHHWTPDGAMLAYGVIMNALHELDETIQPAYTDPAMWQRHSKDHWFLGSAGKRVGTLYAGTDPLIWFTPAFETEMSCVIPRHRQIFKGDFVQVNIRDVYIERADYYHDNPYCVYIGGHYPLVVHRNALAKNHQRILLVNDSFMLPLQAFLSTEFAEMDVIDPRMYKDFSIAEYCAMTRPDVVLMMTSPQLLVTNDYSEYGVAEARASHDAQKWTNLLEDYEVRLPAKADNYNFAQIPVTLERGRTYRFNFESAEITDGQTDGIGVVLFRWDDNGIVQNNIYDVGFCAQNGGEPWHFRVPNDQYRYALLVYAGLLGKTAGNGMRMDGISVLQME